ncbi:MAG: tol-pal system-associated acyl-CoA thioesterase [Gammaproteobacteria bacterium]|nr:MAG: tol-pal system-associated acyl-CoA thioesterase [Gammaproteobacteria bacterium]
MPEFELSTRVFIEDTDAGGIVYYVNYLKYMERARTEWLRDLGFDFASLQQLNSLFVVKNAHVDYLAPAKMDDLLEVTASVAKIARTYIMFKQMVKREGMPLCEATIKVACIDSQSMKPKRIAVELQSALQQQVQIKEKT